MKLNAKPNLNGNTEEDFANVYVQFNRLLLDIHTIHTTMQMVILNSRNYQHTHEDVRMDDRRNTYELIRQINNNIGTIKSAISDVILQEELNND